MAITNTACFDYQYRSVDYKQEANASVDNPELPVVTMTKKASVTEAYIGDTIIYAVNISIGDFQGQITNQVFSDILPPELEFVEGSITVDAELYEGNLSEIPVMWEANSEHLILYKCIRIS